MLYNGQNISMGSGRSSCFIMDKTSALGVGVLMLYKGQNISMGSGGSSCFIMDKTSAWGVLMLYNGQNISMGSGGRSSFFIMDKTEGKTLFVNVDFLRISHKMMHHSLFHGGPH